MLPARFAPILFGFILSGLMTFLVSGLATLRITGVAPEFFGLWMGNWMFTWLVAFPAVLVLGPITRWMVARIVTKG